VSPALVEAFYRRIWNAGELDAAGELLSKDFAFRGSLGLDMTGIPALLDYVRSVRGALADYRCDVLECVAEGSRAFAKMRFCGRHVGVFRGFQPTGRQVEWLGAALFRFEGAAIAELWVLGDVAGLDAVLKKNEADRRRQRIPPDGAP
jgi:predicted ester cyclase